ncbi:MAG: glutaredoxin-related protein [Bacteroides sp.]|nr:glutaredoxin-related protein [Bacteroides sp.]
MIKIYGMSTCVDCTNLNDLVKNNNKYEVIDIGLHVKDLKDFLNLRDNHAVFDQAKKTGSIGIPCFVLEDGTVTLNPEEAGLTIPPTKKSTCDIDGSGC